MGGQGHSKYSYIAFTHYGQLNIEATKVAHSPTFFGSCMDLSFITAGVTSNDLAIAIPFLSPVTKVPSATSRRKFASLSVWERMASARTERHCALASKSALLR